MLLPYPSCLIPVALLLFINLPAQGQVAEPIINSVPPRTYLGFRAGFSSYSISGKEVELHTQPGADELQRFKWFTAGLVARFRVVGPLAVQAEANYLREGGDFTRRAFPGKTNYTVDCVQLPLLLNIELPVQGQQVTLNVEGGIAATFVAREVELDMKSFAPNNKFNNQSAWLAPAVGGELAWHTGPRIYYLNARYTHDLTDYYQRRYYGIDYNARSFGFTVTLGALFGNGNKGS